LLSGQSNHVCNTNNSRDIVTCYIVHLTQTPAKQHRGLVPRLLQLCKQRVSLIKVQGSSIHSTCLLVCGSGLQRVQIHAAEHWYQPYATSKGHMHSTLLGLSSITHSQQAANIGFLYCCGWCFDTARHHRDHCPSLLFIHMPLSQAHLTCAV